MDPASLVADRGGDDVDERGDIVVGGLLALGDRGDVEGGPLPAGGRGIDGHDPLLGAGLDRGQLDLEPGRHLALLGPHCAHFGARVARYHALIMRTASNPAFFAPSIATQPTGTPGGICTAESSASMPPRFLPEIGTPITGRSVWEAANPGSAADMPAPAMITLSPRMRALVQ